MPENYVASVMCEYDGAQRERPGLQVEGGGLPMNSVLMECRRKARKSGATVTLNERGTRSKRQFVMPYTHKISHKVKRMTQRSDVPVVLSAPSKPIKTCPKINKEPTQNSACRTCHRNRSVPC